MLHLEVEKKRQNCFKLDYPILCLNLMSLNLLSIQILYAIFLLYICRNLVFKLLFMISYLLEI